MLSERKQTVFTSITVLVFMCGCFFKTVYLPRFGGGGRQEGLRSGFGCFIVPTTLTTNLQKTAFLNY